MAPRGILAAVTVAGLVAGGGAAVALAPAVIFPKPVVAVSTLTIADRDSLAVVVTAFPKCVVVAGATLCPLALDVRLELRDGLGSSLAGRRSRPSVRAGTRDTIRLAKPVCPDTARAVVFVAAEGRAPAERSDPGLASVRVPCRVRRAAEILEGRALEDTFPKANRRITFASFWGRKVPAAELAIFELEEIRKAKTATDSAAVRAKWAAVAARPDSVYLPPANGELRAEVGFEYGLCWLGRNRYTGAVELLDGDPDRCEAARLAFQAERNG